SHTSGAWAAGPSAEVESSLTAGGGLTNAARPEVSTQTRSVCPPLLFRLATRLIFSGMCCICSFLHVWCAIHRKGCFTSLVTGKVLWGGQQTLSIQCRGGNLSGKRFELRAAENWAGAPLPRFSTMRDAHRPVRFLRVDRPSPSPGVSEMLGPLRRSSSAEEAFLLGSVLGDGLRATDLPREPAGHRSLPPIRDPE